jgi:hypothetical protein
MFTRGSSERRNIVSLWAMTADWPIYENDAFGLAQALSFSAEPIASMIPRIRV